MLHCLQPSCPLQSFPIGLMFSYWKCPLCREGLFRFRCGRKSPENYPGENPRSQVGTENQIQIVIGTGIQSWKARKDTTLYADSKCPLCRPNPRHGRVSYSYYPFVHLLPGKCTFFPGPCMPGYLSIDGRKVNQICSGIFREMCKRGQHWGKIDEGCTILSLIWVNSPNQPVRLLKVLS